MKRATRDARASQAQITDTDDTSDVRVFGTVYERIGEKNTTTIARVFPKQLIPQYHYKIGLFVVANGVRHGEHSTLQRTHRESVT